MHLLDLVSQGLVALVRTPDGHLLPGAGRFEAPVRDCPIRYILSDELARCATELAFADGDRLTSCLDLIRVPARSLWIEWTDAARRLESLAIAAGGQHGSVTAQRAGVLVTAAADGRSGSIRSFWSSREGVAYCSPLTACFDLDGVAPEDDAPDAPGHSAARLSAPEEFGLDGLLDHMSFRFDEEWLSYYRSACTDETTRQAVLRANLGACAFDPPMVFAFLLMLSARGALPRHIIATDRLNKTRRRSGKLPLLDHVMVSAPLHSIAPEGICGLAVPERRPSRLHHVCGHIVRRGSAVFWRIPHLRGSVRLGSVRTRTVKLLFTEQHV